MLWQHTQSKNKKERKKGHPATKIKSTRKRHKKERTKKKKKREEKHRMKLVLQP